MNKKLFISVIAFLSLGLGYFWINKTNWTMMNEKEQYVNVMKVSKDPRVILFPVLNKNMWSVIFNLTQIANMFKTVNGQIIVVFPISADGILEIAQRVRKMQNMNFEIYLASDKLWKKITGKDWKENDEKAKDTYIFVKNGKEIKKIKESVNWMSAEGVQLLNEIFNVKMKADIMLNALFSNAS